MTVRANAHGKWIMMGDHLTQSTIWCFVLHNTLAVNVAVYEKYEITSWSLIGKSTISSIFSRWFFNLVHVCVLERKEITQICEAYLVALNECKNSIRSVFLILLTVRQGRISSRVWVRFSNNEYIAVFCNLSAQKWSRDTVLILSEQQRGFKDFLEETAIVQNNVNKIR